MATRAVAGVGGRGGEGVGRGHFTRHRLEPDISSLWMDLFSLDSVIFVVDFSDTSHDKC